MESSRDLNKHRAKVLALSPEACAYLEKIKKADILVGIPSYNNVLTASYVISQVVKGLETYFSDMHSVLFVSDGNSIDGTLTALKTVQLPSKMGSSYNVNLIPAIYVGISGKGSALKAIFEAARILGTKAVALVDSDLRSITPEWMKLLISPVLNGTGLVVPIYNRRKYDGTITDFLCYPVTASIYGKNIRQPIGGDFGLSFELVEELLASSMWDMPEVHRFGVDIFETHTALSKNFEIKQAALGAKDHDPKDPAKQLAPMFQEVITTMFVCIEKYESTWKKAHGFSDVETVGEEKHANSQMPIQVDLQNIMRTYNKEYNTYLSLYRSVLNAEMLRVFEQTRNLEGSFVSFPMETWAKTVYSFIVAFHKAPANERSNLIEALRILWIGRLASFIKETANSNSEETELKVKEQARVFEKMKPYLFNSY